MPGKESIVSGWNLCFRLKSSRKIHFSSQIITDLSHFDINPIDENNAKADFVKASHAHNFS